MTAHRDGDLSAERVAWIKDWLKRTGLVGDELKAELISVVAEIERRRAENVLNGCEIGSTTTPEHAAVIADIANRGGKKFKAIDVISATGQDAKKVYNVLGYLAQRKRIKRLARGVYQ